MNALIHPKTGYARPDPAVRPPRSIEYEAFARTTKRLAAAWQKRKTDFPGLAAALAENQRLWSALGADVASPENGLPAKLRAQLYYLYEFTDEHSRAVLKGEASVEVLIDINMSVMRGLRGEGGAS